MAEEDTNIQRNWDHEGPSDEGRDFDKEEENLERIELDDYRKRDRPRRRRGWSFSEDDILSERFRQIEERDYNREEGLEKRKKTLITREFLERNYKLYLRKGDSGENAQFYNDLEINSEKKQVVYRSKIIFKWDKEGRIREQKGVDNERIRKEFLEKIRYFKSKERLKELETNPQIKKEVIDDLKEKIQDDLEMVKNWRLVNPLEITREVPTSVEQLTTLAEGETPEGKIKSLDQEIGNLRKRVRGIEDSGVDAPNELGFAKELIKVYETAEEIIRVENGLPTKTIEVQNIVDETIENSEITRFKRFRQFVKDHFGAISSVVVGIGSIVATVSVYTRGAIKSAANNVKTLAKNVKSLVEKVTPMVGAVLSMIAATLKLSGKALDFVAKHLWVFVMACIVLGYKYWGKR